MSIDSIAGPSEITVLADETANPRYVAADLLSPGGTRRDGLRHSGDHQPFFRGGGFPGDPGISEGSVPPEIIEKSLDHFGYILVAADRREAVDAVNSIAPEHLEIVMSNPFEVMTQIRNAGAIFLGEYSVRTSGRLFCRPQPCAAHQRHGKVFLTPVRG